MDAVRRRDLAILDATLAPAFRLTSARSDEWVDRQRWLDLSMTAVELRSFTIEELEVAVLGDAAVVWSKANQVARVNGDDWSERFLLTDVWVNDGERWRVVARHSSQPPTRDFEASL